MKIFLIGFANILPEQVNAVRELAREHTVQYWVRMEHVFPVHAAEFPGTIFHDYRDALRGVPPPAVDTAAFAPLSATRIKELSAAESELMIMMDKWYPAWGLSQRRDLYYEFLRYWEGVLEKLKPDFIFFLEPPHEMYSFVLYTLAKRAGIPTAMFENALRFDRFILFRQYERGNEVLRRAQGEKYLNLGKEVSPELARYWQEMRQKDGFTPSYIQGFKNANVGWGRLKRRGKALLPFVKDGSIVERAVLRLFKLFKSGVKDEYKKYVRTPDLAQPFVYMPLHYQPERTTAPQGDIFVNQLLAVQYLSATLPEGWLLYVKEHPTQWYPYGNDYTHQRYCGFYAAMAALPQVRLVPTTTSTFELTDQARAVASVGGTPAWEAVLRGKPAIIFGYPWFMRAPGIIRVTSVEECRSAFEKIQNGYAPRQEDMRAYFTLLDQVTFLCYADAYGRDIARHSPEQNWRNLHAVMHEVLAARGALTSRG